MRFSLVSLQERHAAYKLATRRLRALRLQRQLVRKRSFSALAKSSPADTALVVVGSVNADMVLQVDRLPQGGETLAAKSLQTYPGGKVKNC